MADPREGKVLQGRYRILSLLAEGGMGVVYKGERVGIGRPVVVKFLHAVLSDKPGIVDRFEREARATARLNHPNCVALVDFGIDEGAPYLVMEYVEGKTLADLLDHGAVKPERAVDIARQLLAGLEHAHERGILHRDLKPANVMIVDVEGYPGDFVKILDFGLAKLAWPGEDKRDVTVEGIAIGTPGYMSPEQAAGVPSDQRSDIYCTGALLYHLVTGTKAFEGDDVRSVLRRHREETPKSPRQVRPGANISKQLEESLYRAMQRDPGKRYQHARDFADGLSQTPEYKRLRRGEDEFAESSSSQQDVPPPTPSTADATRADGPRGRGRKRKRSRGAATWAFVGVLVGSVAAVAAVAYSPLGNLVRPPREPTPVPEAKPEAKPEPTPNHAALATPDMARLAEASVDMAMTPTVVTHADAGNPAVAGNEEGDDDDTPAKSDDGSGENDRTPPPEPAAVAAHAAPSVRNVNDVKALLRKGDSDGALAGLYRLRHSHPAPTGAKASEIATLIGDVYFDKKWWTDGLKEYRFAIAVDGRTKRNEILVSNSVRALGERATYARARRLLLDYVGRGAVPALKRAARSGGTPQLRRRAQMVLATLESKSYRPHR
ncbi:MAG TPA: protein kinase [Polyangia bacterium]|nr:protein kinase [Polyangia bacterium]